MVCKKLCLGHPPKFKSSSPRQLQQSQYSFWFQQLLHQDSTTMIQLTRLHNRVNGSPSNDILAHGLLHASHYFGQKFRIDQRITIMKSVIAAWGQSLHYENCFSGSIPWQMSEKATINVGGEEISIHTLVSSTLEFQII